jgi:Lon protease-like protein
VLEQLGTETLTNSFVAVLPLGVEDKQLLVEADSLANRLRAFTAILEGHTKNNIVRH